MPPPRQPAPSPHPSPVADKPRPGKDSLGPRQAESERRRRRILDAAQECLGELGYARATVTEIARRADVSNGLLYKFFENKERLFSHVLNRVVREWVREMLPREDESASEALEGMFRRSVDFCRTHPLLPALLRQDPELQLSRIQLAAGDRVQPHRDLVARLLTRGIEDGDFRDDLDIAATADVICQLQSAYSGRAYWNDDRFPDDPRIIEAAVALIRVAVGSRSVRSER